MPRIKQEEGRASLLPVCRGRPAGGPARAAGRQGRAPPRPPAARTPSGGGRQKASPQEGQAGQQCRFVWCAAGWCVLSLAARRQPSVCAGAGEGATLTRASCTGGAFAQSAWAPRTNKLTCAVVAQVLPTHPRCGRSGTCSGCWLNARTVVAGCASAAAQQHSSLGRVGQL